MAFFFVFVVIFGKKTKKRIKMKEGEALLGDLVLTCSTVDSRRRRNSSPHAADARAVALWAARHRQDGR